MSFLKCFSLWLMLVATNASFGTQTELGSKVQYKSIGKTQLELWDNPSSRHVYDWDTDRACDESCKSIDRLIVLVHGKSSGPGQLSSLKNAFFSYYGQKSQKIKIINVDWSTDSDQNPYEAVAITPKVASDVVSFLLMLKNHYGLTGDRIHVLGHSYGSHVAGQIGRFFHEKTGTLISRITGVDPGFILPINSQKYKISQKDGDYVDIIHTDGTIQGYSIRLGHADYYPNGGRTQPHLDKCRRRRSISEPRGGDSSCNHVAGLYYFEASLYGTHFWSKCCKDQIVKWKCEDSCGSYMGIQSTKDASGRWYKTEVTANWPYAVWTKPT